MFEFVVSLLMSTAFAATPDGSRKPAAIPPGQFNCVDVPVQNLATVAFGEMLRATCDTNRPYSLSNNRSPGFVLCCTGRAN